MADNVTTDDLELALEQLAESMGLSVVEYVNSLGYATVADVEADVNGLQSQINAIIELDAENGVESLAEKVNAINAVLSDENGVIQAIYTKIQENTASILAETTRATGVEADLQSQITSLATASGATNTTVTAIQTALNGLSDRVTLTESDIATLKGDETVEGSIANLIKVEADRAVAREDDLQAQINAITGGGTGSVAEVAQSVTDLEGVVAQNEANRVAELAQAVADLQAYSDARDLKAGSMDVCKIGNKFRFALGLADNVCDGGTTPEGDGLVI